jgi:response regulator RpfG family c-di-GMP phosphodiesterase
MTLWQRLQRAAPYHAHFLASTNHAWLGLVTLGVGIAVASPLSVVAGIAAYGLGVIFLPDLAVFRKGYDIKHQSEIAAAQQAETSGKDRVRASLLDKLTPAARARWHEFANLCEALRAKLGSSPSDTLLEENFLTKVADSHLLLLGMDADIRDYLKTAPAPADLLKRAEALQAEITTLHRRTDLSDVEQRLILSKEETLKNLQQQAEQNKRMALNLDLAQSELQRLESQISFLRAELISNPASQLSTRLSDTLIQVEASQRVLQEGGMVNAPDLNTLLGERA